MPLGLPVPSNLEEMTLEEVHELHAKMWAEAEEITEKRKSIMGAIYAKQAIRDASTRAGFDTVIGLGKAAPVDVTPATAKEMLEQAKKGSMAFGKAMMDKLKQIAGMK